MNGTAEQAEIELLEFPSPTGICLCDIHPTRIDRRRSFMSGGPCFEVVADRAIDGDDARRLPACPKTSAGLFSTASRRTSSVCHIEEWETSHQKRL